MNQLMFRALFLIILFLTIPANAQTSVKIGIEIVTTATDPTICPVNEEGVGQC